MSDPMRSPSPADHYEPDDDKEIEDVLAATAKKRRLMLVGTCAVVVVLAAFAVFIYLDSPGARAERLVGEADEHFHAGRLADAVGGYRQALEVLDAAPGNEEMEIEVEGRLCDTLVEHVDKSDEGGDLKGAIEATEAILKARCDGQEPRRLRLRLGRLHERRGDALAEAGEHEAALEAYLAANPHLKSAASVSDGEFKRFWKKIYAAHRAAGEAKLKAGDPQKAAEHFLEGEAEDRAIAIYTEQEAWTRVAFVHARAHRWKEAGDFYLKGGNFPLAAESFEKGGSYIGAGQAYLKLDKPKEAAEAFVKAGAPDRAAEAWEAHAEVDPGIEPRLAAARLYKVAAEKAREQAAIEAGDTPPVGFGGPGGSPPRIEASPEALEAKATAQFDEALAIARNHQSVTTILEIFDEMGKVDAGLEEVLALANRLIDVGEAFEGGEVLLEAMKFIEDKGDEKVTQGSSLALVTTHHRLQAALEKYPEVVDISGVNQSTVWSGSDLKVFSHTEINGEIENTTGETIEHVAIRIRLFKKDRNRYASGGSWDDVAPEVRERFDKADAGYTELIHVEDLAPGEKRRFHQRLSNPVPYLVFADSLCELRVAGQAPK